MTRICIQIIEDDDDIIELLQYHLTKEKFDVICATNGEDGFQTAIKRNPDLILLDIMLPGLMGVELCKMIRKESAIAHIPIVMLTAKSEESDIVEGLEAGADDYITKPFSPRVLVAKIYTILNRTKKSVQENQENVDVITFPGLVIDNSKKMALVVGEDINLTNTEFQILTLLARRAGWVFTRSKIVHAVSGDNHAVTDRSVDVHIVGLRKKLGLLGNYIETIRAIGYRFREV